jgi:hypothetical protein
MFQITGHDFDSLCGRIAFLLDQTPALDVGEVHSQTTEVKFHELDNVFFQVRIPTTMGVLQQSITPNLPWAEDHFQERVSGQPLNPPPSAKEWPFAQKDNEDHKDQGQFSHTYPERYWPRFANTPNVRVGHQGIRYRYGDLKDVATLLFESPMTRQAYLPIWFPEDTGAVHAQRVPCSLGYHFMIRSGRLNCTYMIRSCDFYRHFRDDVYMTGRLMQWMTDVLAPHMEIVPGFLTMHIMNLHVFQPDVSRLKTDIRRYQFQINQMLGEAL